LFFTGLAICSSRPADAAADIETPAALRKCNPLSLIAGRRQTARMQMLDGRKGFQE